MLRTFWILITLQAVLVTLFAIRWPHNGWFWFGAIGSYFVFSCVLWSIGLKIGKLKPGYYLITVAGTSLNWLIFGGLGVMLSFLFNVLLIT